MKNNDLSKVPLSSLQKEIKKRERVRLLRRAKLVSGKNKYILGVEYDLDPHNDRGRYGPYFTLGIVNKDGKFLDFYYSSGIDYEIWANLIPDGFREAMESTYEYKDLKSSLKVLGDYGYTYFKDVTEK